MAIQTSEGPYDFVKATVTGRGIRLRYRGSGLSRDGSDLIDDPAANTWTDADIRKVVALHPGITSGQEEIEVVFD